MRFARTRPLPGALAGLWLAAGCGGTGPDPGAIRTAGDGDCIDMPGIGAGTRSRPLRFALTGWVDPSHVPQPRNASEAVVFHHLYEAPFELDCAGNIGPGLVERWEPSEERRTWTLHLRPNAEFALGVPVTAEAVVTAWTDTRRAARDDDRATWVWSVVRPANVEVAGDHELVIRLDEPLDLPELLTRPEFFVVRRDPGQEWPLGTRGFRATTERRASGIRTVTCRDPNDAAVTMFEILHNADARDAIAPGVDAALVHTRSALEFLEKFPDVRLTSLPWGRLHLLLSPAGAPPPSVGAKIRDELARDVAASDARPAASWLLAPRRATEPAWPGGDAASRTPADRRIVAPRRDENAVRLAERIAFLWTERNPADPVRVATLGRREYREALRAGDDLAYVAVVARGSVTGDLQLRDLLDRAPWLGSPAVLVPLVETRSYLVSRSRLVGIETGYDGAPRVQRAAWSGGGTVP
jgi:hypothetical protein